MFSIEEATKCDYTVNMYSPLACIDDLIGIFNLSLDDLSQGERQVEWDNMVSFIFSRKGFGVMCLILFVSALVIVIYYCYCYKTKPVKEQEQPQLDDHVSEDDISSDELSFGELEFSDSGSGSDSN